MCTRVCIDRTKRTLVEFGIIWAAPSWPTARAVTALLPNARLLGQSGQRPAGGNDNIV